MAISNNLISYEMNGVKESFANWISNLSPVDTPFVSLTGKEAIKNKYFQWQEDVLNSASENAVAEGSDAGDAAQQATTVQKNVTQILRKVVHVSDTANALASYGRPSELQYQLEKSGKELKRDIEWALLNNTDADDLLAPGITSGSTPKLNVRRTAGFRSLVAPYQLASVEDPAAIVNDRVKTNGKLTEADIFKITHGLYLAGAKATHIMFHPRFANVFAGLMESVSAPANRIRMFDGSVDQKVNKYVSEIVDPLGQRFILLPNRFMPTNYVYFFNPADWTQMVLRAPMSQMLGKEGSFTKYMIETELGLRHRNRFASGVLFVGQASNGNPAPSITTPTPAGFPRLVPKHGAQSVAAYPATRLFKTGAPKTLDIVADKGTHPGVGGAAITDPFTYTTDHLEYIHVDDKGHVTAVAPGYAHVTVSTGGDPAYVSVYVFDDASKDELLFTKQVLSDADSGLIQGWQSELDGGAVTSKSADQASVVYKWEMGDDENSLTEVLDASGNPVTTGPIFTILPSYTFGKSTLAFRVTATVTGKASYAAISKTQVMDVRVNPVVDIADQLVLSGTKVTTTAGGTDEYDLVDVPTDGSDSELISIIPNPGGDVGGVIQIYPDSTDPTNLDKFQTPIKFSNQQFVVNSALTGVATGDKGDVIVTNGGATTRLHVTFK